MAPQGRVGLLVMAHGGGPEWNLAVEEALAPLRDRLPTALALGMADPATLQASLDSLHRAGVTRVAVVRLFLSGASFLPETEYLLGLADPGTPAPKAMGHASHGAHGGGTLHPLRHDMEILLSRDGLGGSDEAGRIVQARVRTTAAEARPARVLLLAHGMGDESENNAVLRDMERAAVGLRASGIADVRVAALREDWPEERARAERDIRSWVSAAEPGAETLVVPFRLFGFGPYATVLEGLSYRTAPGLLPHALVTRWIEARAAELFCGLDADPALGRCTEGVPVS
jgi:hypothetical protein